MNSNKDSIFQTRNKTRLIINIVMLIFVIACILYIIIIFSKDYNKYNQDSPYLIETTQNGKGIGDELTQLVPWNRFNRSLDTKYGIEFTYGLWLFIEDSNFIDGRESRWKHIFHKGSKNGIPLQSPGVWIYPNENKLAINMNTYYSVKESCDVGNIPLNKWFHLTISVINKNIDIYINCNLKKRCKLKGVPKLNFGDLYISQWSGFDGLISRFRYWNYALDPYQLETICSIGPSSESCNNTKNQVPYLSKKYWMTTGFPYSNNNVNG